MSTLKFYLFVKQVKYTSCNLIGQKCMFQCVNRGMFSSCEILVLLVYIEERSIN